MIFSVPSNGLPFTIILEVKTRKPENISITASDAEMSNAYYISRSGIVKGKRVFELKFPQTPKLMVFNIFNKSNGDYSNDEDKSFEITRFEAKDLKTCSLWADKDIHNFVKFAQQFCAISSDISAGDYKPSIYRSDDGKFCIDYYNKIRSKKTGQFVSTPARIGNLSGVIEVSKMDFDKYTIPMRMVILLHEFSHKYMNEKVGREISNEIAADINALNIYLSLGYPHIEAQYAFLKIFKGANNELNRRRYLILDDFIKKFTQGELENYCTMSYIEKGK